MDIVARAVTTHVKSDAAVSQFLLGGWNKK
jgi:hypothetical protein